MFIVEDEKRQQIHTHVESTQKVSIYPRFAKHKYEPRFHVDNYKPKNKRHRQRSFGSFKNMTDAYNWADEVCSMLPKEDVGDVHAIAKIVKVIKERNTK